MAITVILYRVTHHHKRLAFLLKKRKSRHGRFKPLALPKWRFSPQAAGNNETFNGKEKKSPSLNAILASNAVANLESLSADPLNDEQCGGGGVGGGVRSESRRIADGAERGHFVRSVHTVLRRDSFHFPLNWASFERTR